MIHTIDDLFHAVRALTEELNELERLRGQVRAAEAIANVGKRLVERRSTMTPNSRIEPGPRGSGTAPSLFRALYGYAQRARDKPSKARESKPCCGFQFVSHS
jgi:hypothetical protein